MSGAVSTDTARQNLASLGYKLLQPGRVFVINAFYLIGTKAASLTTPGS
jgi:hypothetical protein